MEKKIAVLLIIVSLLIGFGIGKISEKGIWQAKLAQVQEEIDWLKSQLETFYPPLPEETYGLSGVVTEVGDKFLGMGAQIRVSQFPLPEGKEFEIQNIKVNITEGTEIFQHVYEPSFEKVFLSFEDIKTGDRIIVTSEENIKDKKEITATQIQIGY